MNRLDLDQCWGGSAPPEPTYRILSAAHEVLAEIAPGRPRRRARARAVTLFVLADVEVRRSAGGDLLLFRHGEPRGRTAAEAVECGWAHRATATRKKGSPASLTPAQVRGLKRAFDNCGGRTRNRSGRS
jgi:hypothetical protein